MNINQCNVPKRFRALCPAAFPRRLGSFPSPGLAQQEGGGGRSARGTLGSGTSAGLGAVRALAAGMGGRRRGTTPARRDRASVRQTAQAFGFAKSGSTAAIVIPVIQEFYKTIPILIKVLQSR